MSTMLDLIHELWFLKRDIVSADYDRALERLAQEVPMRIHTYPSEEACWTWRVPEKWTCHEAYLETLDGRRLLDYADHPLHAVSYSLPFEGVVSRDELLRHLHVHPRLPDAIPFVFKYYERDWGLCASQVLRDSLTEAAYRVVIETTFEPGALKVGEVIIPGENERSFMLVAHLCHPAMANDDLSGVVVGLDVARELLAGPARRFTYHMLILPEPIGSTGSYRTIIDNDERQFNAPGVRVPMLSLSRVEAPKSTGRPPYPEYHSSLDTPAIVSAERLEASKKIVLGLIDAWERNQYVVNNFKGEVFASGYGIWIDYHLNPQGHRRLFEIMERCDGERTVTDIALELGLPFHSVWEVVAMLQDKNLVWLSPLPH